MIEPLAIEAVGLRKAFGSVVALDGLDLRVPRGAFYAFLGPNGAGKSTTIATLTGLAAPDAGSVRILGLDALADPLGAKSKIGVVPEELALFERLTGRQQLTFAGRLHGLSGAEAAKRAEELLAITELSSKADALTAEYSKGMRRRLALAAALVHRPDVLLLDEPFEGIDVLAAAVVKELLQELSRRGVTIVLTTHVLEIADRLATHAGIIVAGRIAEEGPVELLHRNNGVDTLEAVFEKRVGVPVARAARLSFYGDGPA